ncbi:hypothetical protein LIER_24325 [Lithospermum erythrorhizon]|uniref:Uncharacterized protein n=1 Tax=Lithospermum erythrorhizon TaxID=34254 RepID=A0AAV3R0V6_LITER
MLHGGPPCDHTFRFPAKLTSQRASDPQKTCRIIWRRLWRPKDPIQQISLDNNKNLMQVPRPLITNTRPFPPKSKLYSNSDSERNGQHGNKSGVHQSTSGPIARPNTPMKARSTKSLPLPRKTRSTSPRQYLRDAKKVYNTLAGVCTSSGPSCSGLTTSVK